MNLRLIFVLFILRWPKHEVVGTEKDLAIVRLCNPLLDNGPTKIYWLACYKSTAFPACCPFAVHPNTQPSTNTTCQTRRADGRARDRARHPEGPRPAVASSGRTSARPKGTTGATTETVACSAGTAIARPGGTGRLAGRGTGRLGGSGMGIGRGRGTGIWTERGAEMEATSPGAATTGTVLHAATDHPDETETATATATLKNNNNKKNPTARPNATNPPPPPPPLCPLPDPPPQAPQQARK